MKYTLFDSSLKKKLQLPVLKPPRNIMKYLKLLLFLLFLPLFTKGQTIYLKGLFTTGNFGTDICEYVDQNTGNVYAIVGGNGMSILDVTDPTNPVQIAHLTSVPGFDVKVWQNYVYCSTYGGGIGRVVDISNPSNPQIVGSFPSPHNICIDERGYMFNSSPGVKIYDLNPDPTSPKLLTHVGSEGHDVTVRGNLMIDCHGGSGTNLYDVTDPASPVLLAAITDPTISYHHQGDISTDENYLYINDEGAGGRISVWNISDIKNPVKVSDFSDSSTVPHNIYVIGDYAYSSYYSSGFRVFDITDPSELVLADEYNTGGSAFGVYPSPETGNIYINDTSGVYIFGFSELLSIEDEITSTSFTIFPNPTQDVLHIESREPIDLIRIYCILGSLVKETSNTSIRVSELPTGVYFAQINTANHSVTKKFIKS